MQLTSTFKEFFDNEKSAGFCLMACAILAMALANSPLSAAFLDFWKQYAGGLSLSHWVNDGLMAIFFLLIGLEIERELYKGELSDIKNALLPIAAALGGIAFPALLHFSLNRGLETQAGIGIPMATDIAFALSVLAILGSRAPASLKIFLTAVAIIDDLCAIIIIAVFYTSQFSLLYLLLALGVFGILIVLNRLRVMNLTPYLIGGALMWFLMLQSGVHATIAGVLVAFTIPFTAKRDDKASPSYQLEHALHKPVAFFILPIFALANAGIIIGSDWLTGLTSPNSMGILVGLFFGKVIGITLASFIAVQSGACRLPRELRWRHLLGAGFLAGIGFTMSIFITNLAFADNDMLINNSKMAILLASLFSGLAGYLLLATFAKQSAGLDED
jgi:NhaA family Na+:H+ antiporter